VNSLGIQLVLADNSHTIIAAQRGRVQVSKYKYVHVDSQWKSMQATEYVACHAALAISGTPIQPLVTTQWQGKKNSNANTHTPVLCHTDVHASQFK
jgi:hypothetical protein